MEYLKTLRGRTRRSSRRSSHAKSSHHRRRPVSTSATISENQDVTQPRFHVSDEVVIEPEYFQCLWPCLRMFRVMGLCPISEQNNCLQKPARICSIYWFPTAILLTLNIICICNYIFELKYISVHYEDDRNIVSSIMRHTTSFIYYFQIFGNLLFAIFQTKKIPKFFLSCEQVEKICRNYRTGFVGKLRRNCFLLLVVFETLQIAGILMRYVIRAYRYYHGGFIKYFFFSFNNGYLDKDCGNYCGVLLFLAQIMIRSTCTFGELLLGIFSLILTHYFEEINRVLASGVPATAEKVEEIRREHVKIWQLLQMCGAIFGPLFLLTYVANMGLLFSGLYEAIRYELVSHLYLRRVECVFRLSCQVIFKLLLPSYLGARLHQTVHQGLDHISNWEVSSAAAERTKYLLIEVFMEHFRFPIALHGCKYFFITKGFIAQLVGALITFVVIVVQFNSLEPETD